MRLHNKWRTGESEVKVWVSNTLGNQKVTTLPDGQLERYLKDGSVRRVKVDYQNSN